MLNAKYRPSIPASIAHVIDRALAFERRDRWPSALDMKAALVQARDESILATAEDWGDENEKTRLAPAPKMTLPPAGGASAQLTPTVPLTTLPAASTVGGVATSGTSRRAHSRRVLKIGVIAAFGAATAGSLLAVVVVALMKDAREAPHPEPSRSGVSSPTTEPNAGTAGAKEGPSAPPVLDVPAPAIVASTSPSTTAPASATVTPVRVPSSPNCQPPFTFDSQGIKRFKSECVR